MTPEQIIEAQKLLSTRNYLLDVQRKASIVHNKPAIQIKIKFDGLDHPECNDIPTTREEIVCMLQGKIDVLTHQLTQLGVVFPKEGVEI